MKKPKPTWTVWKLFKHFYQIEATTNLSRKPTGAATMKKRCTSVRWWIKLMGTSDRPKGPRLCEIKKETLVAFRERLRTAEYQRGPNGPHRNLSLVTQESIFAELMIVIKSAGTGDEKFVRAGVLDSVPQIYTEKVVPRKKPTWTIEEARQIAAGLETVLPLRTWAESVQRYRDLAKATICLWAYTGHRARTYQRITKADLVQTPTGEWVLDIKRSVKTNKPDLVPVHPRLLKCLQALGDDLISWPFAYRQLIDHVKHWQRHAGLPAKRIFSPQGWRRFHAEQMDRAGLSQIQSVTSSALGHSSTSITAGHYSDPRDLLVRQLPDLFVPAEVQAAAA